MATTPVDDDFDMPEFTDEMLMEFKPLTELAHTDLHMDAVQVKAIGKPNVEPFDLVLFGCLCRYGHGCCLVRQNCFSLVRGPRRYIYMKREIINQVRELLDRNLSTAEIAHRLGIDIDLAKMAIDTINQLLT